MGLIDAIFQRDLEQVRQHLVNGADPNFFDDDGRTPLMAAVTTDGISAAIVTSLIEAGASVNTPDKDQEWTALHFAAQAWRADLVDVLLEAGAKVDATDVFGNTALWRAVFNSQGRGEVIEKLLAAGADPDLKNRHGVSARELAGSIANHDVAKFFRANA